MSTRTLRFHLDYLSPYAYLAWTRIHAIAERHGATVEPAPVLLAALLHHHGQLGPAEIPAKRVYVFKDVVRRAHRYGVPLEPPPSHPFDPLPALRATLAVPEERRREAVDALFARCWGDATPRGVDTPERVCAALADAGIALAPESIGSPEVKAALRASTEEAIAADVFGVPTVAVGGELFWGTDSLDLLEDHLAGRDPVDATRLERWRGLPATVTRRR